MALASVRDCRLIVSNLGLRIPALYALKKVGYVDHFYHLTAAIGRLRFPRLRSDVHFEEATEADFAEMLQRLEKSDASSRKEIITRLLFHRSGVPSCYVGRNDENDFVSVQWLMRPRDNALLNRSCRGLYYPLKPNQVLVENLFIFPAFRGLAIFPTVIHGLLDRARREGFQVCHTYVRKDNVTSINAHLDLGFRIRKLLTGYNLAGRSWRTL